MGSKGVHPNDHVNMSQSSNDTFPTVCCHPLVDLYMVQLFICEAKHTLECGPLSWEVENVLTANFFTTGNAYSSSSRGQHQAFAQTAWSSPGFGEEGMRSCRSSIDAERLAVLSGILLSFCISVLDLLHGCKIEYDSKRSSRTL
jgi:hypothetical protein